MVCSDLESRTPMTLCTAPTNGITHLPPPAVSPSQSPRIAAAPELLPDISIPKNDMATVPSSISFLDLTADDKYEPEHIPVGIIFGNLLKDAKKHNAFGTQFKLHAVRNYLELLEHYWHNPKVKKPATQASQAVTKSVGKGPYLACMIRHLVLYIDKFHTLLPSHVGKHHAHPSLLNNECMYQVVHRFLTVQEAGQVQKGMVLQCE